MTAPPTALVTGIAGFCGRHLAAELSAAGYLVIGLDRVPVQLPGADMHLVDLTEIKRVVAILTQVRPDLLFHLAALTDPRLPYEELHHVNALGTLSLLGAARQTCPEVRVLITGTSAVYGRVPASRLPISEDQPFYPTSTYAVSKVAQEMIAYQHFAAHGLAVIRSRAFNLTGPGESPGFVTSAFAHQIAEIEAGQRAPIVHVGNLDTVRDFVDVRDAVRAYRLLAEQGEPGAVYNVCSGRGVPIRALLDALLELARVPGIAVEPDRARLQPADVPISVGDGTYLRTQTGWTPTYTIEQTLRDVLSYWREHVKREL
ncbi:MAG: GDP-mannose 4,6-dehydratase [Anaerolineae bacterium]|nr:GDP-mannose 4,6-dehydratase [Anaerolineae bacterium]